MINDCIHDFFRRRSLRTIKFCCNICYIIRFVSWSRHSYVFLKIIIIYMSIFSLHLINNLLSILFFCSKIEAITSRQLRQFAEDKDGLRTAGIYIDARAAFEKSWIKATWFLKKLLWCCIFSQTLECCNVRKNDKICFFW